MTSKFVTRRFIRLCLSCATICIGAFYYLFGKIRPELHSSLKIIQLLTLVRQSYIKDYGMYKILETFMDGIRVRECKLTVCSVSVTPTF